MRQGIKNGYSSQRYRCAVVTRSPGCGLGILLDMTGRLAWGDGMRDASRERESNDVQVDVVSKKLWYDAGHEARKVMAKKIRDGVRIT